MAMLNNQRVKLHYPPSLPAFFDKPSRCNSSSLSKPSWLSSTALKIPWCILTSENSGAKIQSISIHKHCGDWWGYQGTEHICQCIHTCIYKDGTSIANNYPLVILQFWKTAIWDDDPNDDNFRDGLTNQIVTLGRAKYPTLRSEEERPIV